VLQAAFDQLASKTISVVADRAPCHELMVVNGFDLPSDVFVKKRQAFVGHIFDTHGRFLNSKLLAIIASSDESRSAGRLEFAREPTRSISFQGIYGKTRFLDAMARAAFKGTFFIAALTRRNSG
jgi:hypothetical protein